MSKLFIKTAVRGLLTLTSRKKARKQSEALLRQYCELANDLSNAAGHTSVEVPPMRGVDEDMRKWSFFMILEHNAIVNRSITATVEQLANGVPPSGAARIDPKKDVMPSSVADESQIENFTDSVSEHLGAIKNLGKLRGTGTTRHPIFGDFDAHKWNCMFSFHLGLHYPQAKFVANKAIANQGS